MTMGEQTVMFVGQPNHVVGELVLPLQFEDSGELVFKCSISFRFHPQRGTSPFVMSSVGEIWSKEEWLMTAVMGSNDNAESQEGRWHLAKRIGDLLDTVVVWVEERGALMSNLTLAWTPRLDFLPDELDVELRQKQDFS